MNKVWWASILVAPSCAHQRWIAPPGADYPGDRYGCMRENARDPRWGGHGYDLERYEACMADRGYTTEPVPPAWQLQRPADLGPWMVELALGSGVTFAHATTTVFDVRGDAPELASSYAEMGNLLGSYGDLGFVVRPRDTVEVVGRFGLYDSNAVQWLEFTSDFGADPDHRMTLSRYVVGSDLTLGVRGRFPWVQRLTGEVALGVAALPGAPPQTVDVSFTTADGRAFDATVATVGAPARFAPFVRVRAAADVLYARPIGLAVGCDNATATPYGNGFQFGCSATLQYAPRAVDAVAPPR